MKNLLIICLLFALATAVFMYFDSTQQPYFKDFPVAEPRFTGHEAPFNLHLFLFFTLDDAPVHLNIIKELNQLPAHFKVTGVVPDHQLAQAIQLTHNVSPAFPLHPVSDYHRYKPNYTPNLVGVSENGRLFFMRPVVAGEITSIKNFLLIFYQNIYPSLLKDKQ